MITPKTTYCKECSDIIPLIDQIDCKIFELAKKAYNNIVFGLCSPSEVALDLLHYKRILMYKLVNECYAEEFTVNMIANRVQLLINK